MCFTVNELRPDEAEEEDMYMFVLRTALSHISVPFWRKIIVLPISSWLWVSAVLPGLALASDAALSLVAGFGMWSYLDAGRAIGCVACQELTYVELSKNNQPFDSAYDDISDERGVFMCYICESLSDCVLILVERKSPPHKPCRTPVPHATARSFYRVKPMPSIFRLMKMPRR